MKFVWPYASSRTTKNSYDMDIKNLEQKETEKNVKHVIPLHEEPERKMDPQHPGDQLQ